jgi:hypothetical protein
MLSALGRIAGIVAPFAGQAFLANDSSGKFASRIRPPWLSIRFSMAWSWWYLAIRVDDDLPARRDEEEADVLGNLELFCKIWRCQ